MILEVGFALGFGVFGLGLVGGLWASALGWQGFWVPVCAPFRLPFGVSLGFGIQGLNPKP